MLIIPFQKNLPSFSQEVTIDGISYLFEFFWNSRGEHWTMSIFNRDQLPLVVGIRLVLLYGLISQYVDRGLPPGEIYVIDLSDNTEEIKQNDFDSRLYLTYFTEEEVESL